MEHRRRPSGVKRRPDDFVAELRPAKICILAGIDERIVTRDGVGESLRRHRYALIFHRDFPRQLFERIGGEEKTRLAIDMWRRRLPMLAANGLGVKDRPDRSAAVMAVTDSGQGRVDEIAGMIFCVFGVEVVVRLVRIDAQIGAVSKVIRGLVVEAPTQHVDQDYILPVLDGKPYGARLCEYRAARMPAHVDITILAADRARLGNP